MAEKNRKKFLDKEGMDYLVGKILELLEEKSDKDLSNVDNSDFADKAQKAGVGGAPVVTATSTDGENYKSTVNGVVQLTTGMTITIIPNITSTKTSVNLDINDLGAKPIRMRTGYDTGTTKDGVTAGWMTAQKPVQLQYDGTCWIADLPRADANAITGTISIEHGGTGATTKEEARTNLGIGEVAKLNKIYSVGTSEPTDKLLLWIDTTENTGGLKYYNGSAWVHVPVSYT